MDNAEYLKRYLSKSETTKKKKKVKQQKSHIIDDDVDLSQIAVASQENSEDDDENPVKILEYLESEKANTIAFTSNNWINCDESADIKIEAPDHNRESLPGFSFGKVTVKEEPLSPRPSEVGDNNSSSRKSARNRKRHDSNDEDASPPRKSARRDSDTSPPRRSNQDGLNVSPHGKSTQHDTDESPPRRPKGYDSDSSPPRKSVSRNDEDKRKLKSRHDSPPRKTGESSGLKIKTERLSPRQDRHLRTGEGDSSPPRRPRGKNAENSKQEENVITMREKTGKKVNLEEIKKKKQEEEARKNALKAKYDEWSRGLKQKEMMNQMADDFEKESNKPLARYADDADMNEELRGVENKEDPMYEYMRKKRAKEAGKSGKGRPIYEGAEPPPNRFNIRPGYRWDGVDRSNGFEKQFFAAKNERKATKDIAYKWSTEDM